jgi:hypothetical protein
MLIDASLLTIESDHRRAALLADAENFRLARLARRFRRTHGHPEEPRGRPAPAPGPAPAVSRS